MNSRSSEISNIKVMYANAQSLKRKMSELLTTTEATTRCFDRLTLDYSNADFCAMRQALSEVDWSHALKGDTNSQWTSLVSIMKSLESRYVPLRSRNKR